MKKYLIFDLGEVMVRFSPIDMCRKFIQNESEARLVCDVLFDRIHWDRLDAGTIDDSELLAEVKKRLPKELFQVAEKIYGSWFLSLPEIPGMRELALKLKEKYSLSLALLSNVGKAVFEHEGEIPILDIFDKKFYSAVIGYTKPSPEIYDYVCNSCGISPSEAIFVDDNEKNVRAAENFGIKAIKFTGDVGKLKSTLIEILDK
ncbi:MAG: HAD family phosphatase [Clostridia bacterium]|nr:HAD family phosphatase [Clostridia bacterium]